MTDDQYICSSREEETPANGSTVDDELLLLARALRHMPDREPPSDLADKILRSLEPKRISFWRRLFLWAAAPRSLTISPIKLIPTAVALSIALLLVIHFFPKTEFPYIMNASRGKQQLVSVVFAFEHPQARSVSLIGSFNQWNPTGFEMHPRGDKKVWVLELTLPPGRYEYAFLLNGKVVQTDPTSPFSERDGFGNKNSIIFVTDDYAKNI